MIRATAAAITVLLLVAMSACLPASGQEKPADFLRRLLSPVEQSPVEQVERPPAPPIDPSAPAKLCFWKSPSVSGFGKSGFCDVSSQLPVGAACRCASGSPGRPDIVGEGSVILAPTGNSSSNVVR